MTQAYIIIDMQNDFIDGSLGTPGLKPSYLMSKQKSLPAKKIPIKKRI